MKIEAIQSVTTWYNGVEINLTHLGCVVASDNLVDAARFQYSLFDADDNPIIVSQIGMGGQDYENWNANPDINQAAIEWVAQQLNLILI